MVTNEKCTIRCFSSAVFHWYVEESIVDVTIAGSPATVLVGSEERGYNVTSYTSSSMALVYRVDWNHDFFSAYIRITRRKGDLQFMHRKWRIFLLVLMLFSSVGDGILVLCVGNDGHRALKVTGKACDSETKNSLVCFVSELHFDAMGTTHNSESNCDDTPFELSDYRYTRNHSFCNCHGRFVKALIKFSPKYPQNENYQTETFVSSAIQDIHLLMPTTSQTVLLI